MTYVPVAHNQKGDHVVNTFPNMDAVYSWCNFPIVTRFYSNEQSKQQRIDVTKNEIHMVQDWVRANNHAFVIGNTYGWKIEERYGKFLQLCKDQGNRQEEFQRVDALVQQILTWVGFQYAAKDFAFSLEGLIEYADRGAVITDHVLAWEQAKFAATHQGLSDAEIRGQFERESPFALSPEGKNVFKFKHLLEKLARPRELVPIDDDEVGMSISSAFQDFRRKNPVHPSAFLTKDPHPEAEQLLKQQLEEARPALVELKEILHTHFGDDIPNLYWALKDNPGHPEAKRADDLRRSLSISTLYILVRMVQNQLISKECYFAHRAQIQDLLQTCNQMDKCNLEIKICGDKKTRTPKEGAYSKDDIPSHYPFFERLDAALVAPQEAKA